MHTGKLVIILLCALVLVVMGMPRKVTKTRIPFLFLKEYFKVSQQESQFMTRISRFLNPFQAIEALISRTNDGQQARVAIQLSSMYAGNRDGMKNIHRLKPSHLNG